MKGKAAIDKAEALKDLEKGIDLIIAPNAKVRSLERVGVSRHSTQILPS